MKLTLALFALIALAPFARAQEGGVIGKESHGRKIEWLDARPVHSMGKEGHGGHGVVCTGATGRIESVELFDLWEGRQAYGLQTAKWDGDWKTIVGQILTRLDADQYSLFVPVAEHARAIMEKLQFIEEGAQLPDIDDEDALVIPRDCAKKTIASYVNDDLVLVDSVYWNHLSETGKAGLVMHEAWYRYLRETDGITGSQRPRHVNAHFMAGKRFDSPVAEHDYGLACSDLSQPELNLFRILKVEENGETYARISFNRLDGETVLSRRLSQHLRGEWFFDLPSPSPSIVNESFILNTESEFEGDKRITLRGHRTNGVWIFNLSMSANDHRGTLQFPNISCTAKPF